MRRLRVLLPLVLMAVSIPVFLLVWRALDAVAVERESGKRVVASRAFDEMELAIHAQLNASLLEDSPSRPPFVDGYFTLSPDRTISTQVALDHPRTRQAPPSSSGQLWSRTSRSDVVAPNEATRGLDASLLLQIANQFQPAAVRDEQTTVRKLPPSQATEARNNSALEAIDSFNRKDRGSNYYGPPVVEDSTPLQVSMSGSRHAIVYKRTAGETKAAVINRERYLQWLREVALADTAIADATLRDVSGLRPAAERNDTERTYYTHQFSAPLEAFAVELGIEPLSYGQGEGSIYLLSLLVLAAVAAALFAVYRTAAVVVAFAERRANFVSAVTHELRTPLTSIRMYGEMLRDGMVLEADKRHEYYEVITSESERLSRLIDNVLEFARLERDKRKVSLSVGDVGPVVREVTALLRPYAAQNGFQIDLRIAENMPPVAFERDALSQVIYNLIDNAIKYGARSTTEKVVHIVCSQDRNSAVIRVRDNGPGVAAEHIAHIFEAFYRGENELVRTTKGTGLGLALVKMLIDNMNGQVSGENQPSGGFEVTVALPVAAAS